MRKLDKLLTAEPETLETFIKCGCCYYGYYYERVSDKILEEFVGRKRQGD